MQTVAPMQEEYRQLEADLLQEQPRSEAAYVPFKRLVTGKFKRRDKRVRMEIIRDILDAFVQMSKPWINGIDKKKAQPSRHVIGREFEDTEHCMFYVLGKMNKCLPVEATVKTVDGLIHVYHTSYPRVRVPAAVWQDYLPSEMNENGDVEFRLEINEAVGQGRRGDGQNRRQLGPKRQSTKGPSNKKRLRRRN